MQNCSHRHALICGVVSSRLVVPIRSKCFCVQNAFLLIGNTFQYRELNSDFSSRNIVFAFVQNKVFSRAMSSRLSDLYFFRICLCNQVANRVSIILSSSLSRQVRLREFCTRGPELSVAELLSSLTQNPLVTLTAVRLNCAHTATVISGTHLCHSTRKHESLLDKGSHYIVFHNL